MNSQNLMDRPAHRIASILAVSALALGLAACGKTEEPTVGQRLDSAVEKTEHAAADARVKAESAMQSAETKMEQGAANAEATAKDAANTAKGAIDDATITAQVNAGLAKDPDLSALKINVDTVNGKVTLNGPAPSTVARDRAETIAKSVTGVTSVNNQLVVTAS
ncbi:osmotically-inducible protein OsmY [Acidovorax delafieldii]|uniref:Osmotically-inducible protein OsmY n=1 Tax=Acidovorax delafieldii TaxID=47920 RepID=A0AAJ2F0P6_ACIDE|nr:BON domain-containing protein [Acidovorax delafieldii]MDR6766921.1 osmotically-inducible protein OsmY [Acidovorax delafieldii]MDR6838363.1 osmotically-inducible protein OsmY [Acidovorax delafieldii]MDR7367633.1 osmotically-inducible protein OsmY [Acidovorax delafieldii]